MLAALSEEFHHFALYLQVNASTVQYSTAQHSTAQHSTAQHSTASCIQILTYSTPITVFPSHSPPYNHWNSKNAINNFSRCCVAYFSRFVSTAAGVVQSVYDSISKRFRTGRLERELQMVQLFATRCSCFAIL